MGGKRTFFSTAWALRHLLSSASADIANMFCYPSKSLFNEMTVAMMSQLKRNLLLSFSYYYEELLVAADALASSFKLKFEACYSSQFLYLSVVDFF